MASAIASPSVADEAEQQEMNELQRLTDALSAAAERRKAMPRRRQAIISVARRCRLFERLPLFSRLTRSQLRILIKALEVVEYAAGEVRADCRSCSAHAQHFFVCRFMVA